MKKYLIPLMVIFSINSFAQNAFTHPLLIDTHNDVLSNELINHEDFGKLQQTGNFDLVRAKKGGQDGQVFSIWCGSQYGRGTAYKFANREIDSLYAVLKRYPDKITLVRNSAQLEQAVADHKFAAMIGVEGGHMIEDRLDYIDSLHKRGMFNPHLE
jgi:membrane dipeptidase